MALIQCIECGQSMSSTCSACPHCGSPLAPPNLANQYSPMRNELMHKPVSDMSPTESWLPILAIAFSSLVLIYAIITIKEIDIPEWLFRFFRVLEWDWSFRLVAIGTTIYSFVKSTERTRVLCFIAAGILIASLFFIILFGADFPRYSYNNQYY